MQVLQVVLNNPGASTVNLTGLTLADAGTGIPSTGISAVTITNNGTPVGNGTFLGTTAVIPVTDTIAANSSVTHMVSVNFSGTANGTFELSLTTGTGTESGQGVNFSGTATGATVTVSTATSTPTKTTTATPTLTPTNTATATPATQHRWRPSNPANSSHSGAVNVQVLQVVLTNPGTSAVNLTGLTLAGLCLTRCPKRAIHVSQPLMHKRKQPVSLWLRACHHSRRSFPYRAALCCS